MAQGNTKGAMRDIDTVCPFWTRKLSISGFNKGESLNSVNVHLMPAESVETCLAKGSHLEAADSSPPPRKCCERVQYLSCRGISCQPRPAVVVFRQGAVRDGEGSGEGGDRGGGLEIKWHCLGGHLIAVGCLCEAPRPSWPVVIIGLDGTFLRLQDQRAFFLVPVRVCAARLLVTVKENKSLQYPVHSTYHSVLKIWPAKAFAQWLILHNELYL